MLSKPRKVRPEVTAGDTSNQNQCEGTGACSPRRAPPPRAPAARGPVCHGPRAPSPSPARLPSRAPGTPRARRGPRTGNCGAGGPAAPPPAGDRAASAPRRIRTEAGRLRSGSACRQTSAGKLRSPLPSLGPGRAARPSPGSRAQGLPARRPGTGCGAGEGEASPRLTRT